MYTNKWDSINRGYGYDNDSIPDVEYYDKKAEKKLRIIFTALFTIMLLVCIYGFILAFMDNDILLTIISGFGILSLLTNIVFITKF